MPIFKRGLSDALTDALRNLARERDPNWWKDVLVSKDILLAVRDGYLNAYVRGQSIFKIGPEVDAGIPRVTTHYKYLVEPEVRRPYVRFNGCRFDLEPEQLVRRDYRPGETLPRMIRTAMRFAGAEKDGVHRIANREPKIVDVEIAFSTQRDGTEKFRAPRMDLAVLVPDGPGAARLVFCEAKCADNVELRSLAKPADPARSQKVASVVSQIRGYQDFISDPKNNDALRHAYVSACAALTTLNEHRHQPIDPLIRDVGSGRATLAIEPGVYLLIFGFDAAQKKARPLNNLLAGLRDSLGHRVVDKGSPDSFRLSDDVARPRTAKRPRAASTP